MDELVNKTIMEYTGYTREKMLYERYIGTRENQDILEALVLVNIKVGVVECWFELLDFQERFAFRQTLQGTQSETAAMQSAAMDWMWRISIDGCSPWQAREKAIAKITAFVAQHHQIMYAIFEGDL